MYHGMTPSAEALAEIERLSNLATDRIGSATGSDCHFDSRLKR
jgi:hypothetical protein